MAEVGQHVLEKHGDHDLVLDDENAPGVGVPAIGSPLEEGIRGNCRFGSHVANSSFTAYVQTRLDAGGHKQADVGASRGRLAMEHGVVDLVAWLDAEALAGAGQHFEDREHRRTRPRSYGSTAARLLAATRWTVPSALMKIMSSGT